MGIYQLFISTIRQIITYLYLPIIEGVDMLLLYAVLGCIVITIWFFRKAVRE